MTVDIKDMPFFCSWSGGKDCCLSLYRTIQQGGQPQLLFTMFEDQCETSYEHRLSREIIYAQAESLNLPIEIAQSSLDNYKKIFSSSIETFKSLYIDYGVFGGTTVSSNNDWHTEICTHHELEAYHPLIESNSKDILLEFINLGFQAIIVAVKEDSLDSSFLGKVLSKELIEDFMSNNIDICGRNGEYHTLVVNGPLFSKKINVIPREIYSLNGISYLNLELNVDK